MVMVSCEVAKASLLMALEDLRRVMALEDLHCKILVSSCTFAYVCEDEDRDARLRLWELGVDGSDSKASLWPMPLSLHLCSILFQARKDYVGYEAAVIVAWKLNPTKLNMSYTTDRLAFAFIKELQSV